MEKKQSELCLEILRRFHKADIIDDFIPELLKDLGFVTIFKGREGYLKLDHPDLMLEFAEEAKEREILSFLTVGTKPYSEETK